MRSPRIRSAPALAALTTLWAVAAGADGVAPTPTEAPRLRAPTLHAEAIGPTLVRLTATVAPGDERYVYTILTARTDPDGRSFPSSFTSGPAYEASRWTRIDGVAADATYRYRVAAHSGIQSSHASSRRRYTCVTRSDQSCSGS